MAISSREIKRKIKYHRLASARYKAMETMGSKRRSKASRKAWKKRKIKE